MRPKHLRIAKFILGIAVVLALPGCTSAPDVLAEQEQATVGTNGQLIPIQSDNVTSAGYDAGRMVMTVQFRNGAVYEYYGVASEVWTSFLAAQPHPWNQVGYPQLVAAGVPYKRIT